MSERAAAPSRALVVTTMMLGTISTILSATIVNVAFPALIDEFHVGHDTLQWVAAGFLAATTATMLTTAWLVETFGERATFVATLSLFLAASLLAAASWSTDSLITARVLQGAAAGVLQPLAMIVLFRVFPIEERGRAMALYGFGIVLAPAIGPAIGGTLLDAFGWRSIFLLTVPFCIAGLALGARTLQDRGAGRAASLRLARLRCCWSARWSTLLNVPVIGHRQGFASRGDARAHRRRARTVGGVRRLGNARAARRCCRSGSFATARSPARRSSRSRTASGSSAARTSCPVFAQDIAHYSAAEAGYLLAPPGIALAFAIALGGRLTDRIAGGADHHRAGWRCSRCRACCSRSRALRPASRCSRSGSSSAASASAC